MPADVLLDAIQSRTESRDTELRYRGYKMPNENVAVPRHGAQVRAISVHRVAPVKQSFIFNAGFGGGGEERSVGRGQQKL